MKTRASLAAGDSSIIRRVLGRRSTFMAPSANVEAEPYAGRENPCGVQRADDWAHAAAPSSAVHILKKSRFRLFWAADASLQSVRHLIFLNESTGRFERARFAPVACAFAISSRPGRALSQICLTSKLCGYFVDMNLADRVAQCRRSLRVQHPVTGRELELNNATSFAERVAKCPIRYALSDDLTRLCAELAYSKGARNLAYADLLHIPAESLWVEWCNLPWQNALQQYGFSVEANGSHPGGRRGAFIRSSADGRRGTVRTFWTSQTAQDVLASSMEAYFDFDTLEGEEPGSPDIRLATGIRVYDGARARDDVLARCFRFRYEESWADYYAGAALSAEENAALLRHVLGTVAIDIPLLLTFLLLLASRTSLPRQLRSFERLNRMRRRGGKVPLLEHIEVRAPVLTEYLVNNRSDRHSTRRPPRLHHVRGHLMRRGSQLYWRVPHLRGSARSGVIRTRTVTWTFDDPSARQRASAIREEAPPP